MGIAKEDNLLTGVRILDLADETASFCTRILADLGAYVVKVERPGGDASRGVGPFLGNSTCGNGSLSFLYNNIGKSGITLDIENSRGREIFLQLVKRSDVIVETYPPGYLGGIGLGFEVLCKANPQVILVSVTGFGQDGPRAEFKACDIVACAYGGQMKVTGFPLRPPLKIFGEQSYFAASLFAAVAVLLALRKREKDQKGDHIDISLQEAVCSTLEHVMVQFFYDQTVFKRQGSLSWNNAFCILPCKNGFIHVTISQQWETLVGWMDQEHMAEDLRDEKWRSEEYRNHHRDHILKIMERWTGTHTVEELVELGQLMRFPWGPVQSPRQVLNSPQLEARQFFVDIDHSGDNEALRYAGLPVSFSSPPPPLCKHVPTAGQDNEQIYMRELGISEEELRSLSSFNII